VSRKARSTRIPKNAFCLRKTLRGKRYPKKDFQSDNKKKRVDKKKSEGRGLSKRGEKWKKKKRPPATRAERGPGGYTEKTASTRRARAFSLKKNVPSQERTEKKTKRLNTTLSVRDDEGERLGATEKRKRIP